MITYVTGTLGAGKTFQSVRIIIRHLTSGGIVVTNIEIDRIKLAHVMETRGGVYFEQDQLIVFDPEQNPNWQTSIPWGSIEGDVLVVMDEAQLFYNARDWAITAARSRELLSFLTQSRKAGVDVLWITQDGGNVDKQFRVLAEWELAIISTKHLPLGWLGKLPFSAYCVKHISCKGNFVVRREWELYSKWIKGVYVTNSMLNSHMRDLKASVEVIAKRKLKRVSAKKRFFYQLLNILKS